MDRAGNIYVVDTGNHRVQVFDANGMFLAEWGSFGSRVSQFDFPVGIAIDETGNVYVMDTGNDRVQVFAPGR